MIYYILYLRHYAMAHWGHDIGADILQTFFKIFLQEQCCILIRIALLSVHNGPNNRKLALIYTMAWHRRGDKKYLSYLGLQS